VVWFNVSFLSLNGHPHTRRPGTDQNTTRTGKGKPWFRALENRGGAEAQREGDPIRAHLLAIGSSEMAMSYLPLAIGLPVVSDFKPDVTN
jgi:hypothetical protein